MEDARLSKHGGDFTSKDSAGAKPPLDVVCLFVAVTLNERFRHLQADIVLKLFRRCLEEIR